MSSGQTRGRERMPHFAASPPALSYPITTCILVLCLITTINGQCSFPNCTKPTDEIFGGGTPSFSPDQDCYAEGTPYLNVSCDDGYLFGLPTLGECGGGTFISERPHCEKSSCGTISVADDVIVDNPAETSLYDMVTFSCDTGRFLDGPSMAWCQGTGLWYPSHRPNCSDYCTTPAIDNGNVVFIEPEYTDTPYEGIQITITCDTGYSLTGPSNVTCHTEEWSPDVGECFADCASPSIPNSNYATDQGSTEHADYIIVTCNENFTSGTGDNVSEPLTCNDAIWDRTVTCYADCPVPTILSNGAFNGSDPFYHNDVIVFSCDPGYTLVGDTSSTCSDGTWTNENPVCYADCELPVIPNSSLNETGEFVPHGTSVTVTCNEGYFYPYNATNDGTSTCDNGTMNVTAIECKETCDSLTIDNSNLDSIPRPIASWQPVVIDCDDGFTSGTGVDQNETIICTGNSWNTDIYCYENCPNISSPNGGSISGDTYPFYHGESVSFTCNDDTYVLVGETNITCNDGAWSNTVPECKESCPPPSIANATYYDRDPSNGNYTLHGDYAFVYCDSGFTSGTGSPVNETIYCDGGIFNRTVFCYADCGTVTAPENGTAYAGEEPHHHGSQANFTCDDGFTLTGNDTVTCEDGDWTPDFPVCGRDCSDPGTPINGSQTGDTSYAHLSVLGFECNDGLAVLGAAEITCMFGTWSGPVPTCFNETVVDLIGLTCTDEDFTVQIPWSLVDGHLMASEIVLNGNTSCRGTGNATVGFVCITSRLDECGTQRQETIKSGVYYDMYTNNVGSEPMTSNYSGPTVDIDVACSYDRERSGGALGNLSYVLSDFTFSKSIAESGQFTFDFDIYTDVSFTSVVTSMPLPVALDETVFFGVGVRADADSLRVIAQTCWATPSDNPDDADRWNLITSECADEDETTLTFYEDVSRSLFSVNSFRFVEMDSLIYIHCDVIVCKQTSGCITPWTSCPGAKRRRRKRSTHFVDSSKMARLRTGPLRWAGSSFNDARVVYRQERDASTEVHRDESLISYIVVLSCLSVLCLVLVVSLAIITAKIALHAR